MNLDSIEIVKMQLSHVNDVYEIEKICFSQPWSVKGIYAELENDMARVLVAIKDGKVVGYVGMHNICSCGYLTNLAVLPKHRRCGIARALLDNIISIGENECMEFISLEVREGNEVAIKLYRSLGFKEVGIRKNFYLKPTENAVIMTKFLRSK